MLRRCRIVWILVLALLAGPAFALGLGQIEVLSKYGQPLLAEIPIVSSDPSELEQLQARLASADTFARIGLDPPQGVVSNLHFEVALDRQGRPVIRVTSVGPVQEQTLTFLVEVDWGQGKLVREYSALLDAPTSVAAAALPVIQAPTAAPSNTIVRASDETLAQRIPADVLARSAAPVDAAALAAARAAATAPTPGAETASPETAAGTAASSPAAAPLPAAPSEAPAPVPGAIAIVPDAVAPPAKAIAPVAAAPSPAPAAPAPVVAPTPTPVAAAAQSGADSSAYGPIKRGETIGAIAASLASDNYSPDQTMLALLRANPEAFIGGNINLVKQGAVLRVPPADEITSLGSEAAAALVQEQVAQWRQARAPTAQPAALVGQGVVAAVDRTASAAAPAAPRRSAARLEIVPPSPNGGRRAGTTSGIEAGGEGQMLRQELQQKTETLAARESEVQELKARLADLEKLQQQQQQLLTLKDSELAAAQQRLAQSNALAAATPAASTTTPVAAPQQSSSGLLLIGGGVLVLLTLFATWWMRRSRAAKPARSAFDTRALPAVPTVVDPVDAAVVEAGELEIPSVERQRADAAGLRAVAAIPATPTFAASPVVAESARPAPAAEPPAWNAGAAIMPTWHGAPSVVTPITSASRAQPAQAAQPADDRHAASRERLELARAYIDLGDVDTARGLLQEVVASEDAGARGEASRLLRELA